MEFLLFVLGIFGKGVISKAGGETFDAGRKLLIKKLKGTKTGNALEAGAEIDPEQAVIDVEAIATDSDIEKLRAQIETLLAQNEDLRNEISQVIQQQPQSIIKKIKGINVESGGVVNNPTFNF